MHLLLQVAAVQFRADTERSAPVVFFFCDTLWLFFYSARPFKQSRFNAKSLTAAYLFRPTHSIHPDKVTYL